jgi:MFS family permease
VALAMAGHAMRRGRWLAISAMSFCAMLLAFSFARVLWLAAVLLAGVGFAMIQTNALANGLLQTLAPDGLRGRVMSAYAFVFVGLTPVGALLGGTLAELAGAPVAIGAGALAMMLVAGWVLLVRREVKGL